MSKDYNNEKPNGHLTVRCLAMPADTNPQGDILVAGFFHKWILRGPSIANEKQKGES